MAFLGIAGAVALGAAHAPVAWANAIPHCMNPAGLCSWDFPLAEKARTYERRAEALRTEIDGTIIPQLERAKEIASFTTQARLREYWSRIEKSAFYFGRMDTANFDRAVNEAFVSLASAVQAAPGLDEQTRAEMIARISRTAIHLPSQAQNPAQAMRICGSHGLAIQGYAEGREVAPAEVVLCPGALLLENLTAEYSRQARGGMLSPLQIILVHELGHHLGSLGLSAETSFKQCLIDTLGIRGDTEQLDEVAADFWVSEVIHQTFVRASADPFQKRQALAVAAVPVCVTELLAPNPATGPETATHFRTLPRLSLSLTYHPRLRSSLGCERFTLARPTCDLGGSFPKSPGPTL
jgi:hypothetical protein